MSVISKDIGIWNFHFHGRIVSVRLRLCCMLLLLSGDKLTQEKEAGARRLVLGGWCSGDGCGVPAVSIVRRCSTVMDGDMDTG